MLVRKITFCTCRIGTVITYLCKSLIVSQLCDCISAGFWSRFCRLDTISRCSYTSIRNIIRLCKICSKPVVCISVYWTFFNSYLLRSYTCSSSHRFDCSNLTWFHSIKINTLFYCLFHYIM